MLPCEAAEYLLWLPPLAQTKTGAVAAGPTAQEFAEKVMRDNFIPAADAVKAEFSAVFERWGPIIWSYDNASIHLNKQRMRDIGITPAKDNRLPLPPLSGDMHKVIEHVHPRVCSTFKWWVLQQGKVLTPEAYMQKFEEVFFAEIKPHQIEQDCKSLKDLYAAIIQADGGYVLQKSLR